jgi:hypothetical protein
LSHPGSGNHTPLAPITLGENASGLGTFCLCITALCMSEPTAARSCCCPIARAALFQAFVTLNTFPSGSVNHASPTAPLEGRLPLTAVAAILRCAAGIEGYRLGAMRITFQRFRMATAFSLALWMAALACVTGCMVPAFASASPKRTSCPEESGTDLGVGLMAGMANCPHAGHHSPAKPLGGKSAPSGGMSCCFLNANVPAKMRTPEPQLVAAHLAVPVAIFDVTPVWIHSAPALARPVIHQGRDTLLQTHLLRI